MNTTKVMIAFAASLWVASTRASKCWLRQLAMASLLAAWPLAYAAASLADREVDFNIPAQSLSTALLTFADQAGVQIVTSGAVLPSQNTLQVTGRQTIRSALQALLSGTRLSFQLVGDTTVTLVSSETTAEPTLYTRTALRLAQAGDQSDPAGELGPAPPTNSAAGRSEDGNELETVTVSASNITFAGYEQPTPVQTVDLAQLRSAARLDVTDSLRNLPSFAGSSSPQNSKSSVAFSAGNAGLNLVNMRGLGVNRTLVLIDGQRVVYGALTGGVDTSNIPTALVKRVDVVTGGASAIWGSDAVAGVVNYVLDKEFTGVEFSGTASNNWRQEHALYRADLAVGTPFADGRGHVALAGSFLKAPDTFFSYQNRGGAAVTRLMRNPACNNVTAANGVPTDYPFFCPQGETWFVPALNPGNAVATPGGLINGCRNAAGALIANCSLNNIMFVGPDAEAQVFIPGNVTQSYQSGGTVNNLQAYFPVTGAPQKNTTGFALGSFDINDHLKVTAQLNYGYNAIWSNTYFATQNAVPIASGNPFIPAQIQSQMTAQGISALQVGTTNTNPFTGPTDRVQDLYGSLGGSLMYITRKLTRGVVGLEGDFGSDWTWNAYYGHSQTKQFQAGLNNQYIPARTNALNAVRVGTFTPTYNAASHPNPLGLPAGSITCLSNLLPAGAAGRTTDCAPLNILGSGPGVASQAAIDYIQGVAHSGGNTNTVTLTQDVAAATLQGLLPWGLSAGQVAMAAGVVYRKEDGLKVNCGEPCDQVTFPFGNFANFDAGYSVKEGSLEFNAPLLRDTFVQDLNIGLAYRGIDYSSSGFVSTYKLGLVSQVNDVVRLRASYSADIRAGNLSELYSNPQTDGSSTIDPRTGINQPMFGMLQGNPDLIPESATTRTAGIVLTPFEGLVVSLDWYDIAIKDVINSGLPSTTIIQDCLAGIASACSLIVYGDYPRDICTGPAVNSCPLSLPYFGVNRPALNSDNLGTAGLDFVGNYRRPFLAGTVNFSTNLNYVFNQNYTTRGHTCDVSNNLGGARGTYAACIIEGNPKFRGNVDIGYGQGGWLGSVGVRMVGASHLVSRWESGVEVPDNDLPFVAYFDARLSYQSESGLSIFGAIDNLADKDLLHTPTTPYNGSTLGDNPIRDDVYDGYGRVWRLGVRMRF